MNKDVQIHIKILKIDKNGNNLEYYFLPYTDATTFQNQETVTKTAR